jgi:hypothetical protein
VGVAAAASHLLKEVRARCWGKIGAPAESLALQKLLCLSFDSSCAAAAAVSVDKAAAK